VTDTFFTLQSARFVAKVIQRKKHSAKGFLWTDDSQALNEIAAIFCIEDEAVAKGVDFAVTEELIVIIRERVDGMAHLDDYLNETYGFPGEREEEKDKEAFEFVREVFRIQGTDGRWCELKHGRTRC
jgi:hypothetical protein